MTCHFFLGTGDFLPNYTAADYVKNYEHVNDALKATAAHNDMTGFVCAKGLTSNPDNLHFSAKALREFGIRYYNEFIKLENKDKVFIEKPTEDEAIKSVFENL